MTTDILSPDGLRRRFFALLRKPLPYWLLLAASALITPWAFAPYRHYLLMPLSLGVLVLLVQLRPNIAVRSAYLWGLCAYCAQLYWIDIALHDTAGLAQVYAIPLTLLLPAYLALYPALVFWSLEKVPLSAFWRMVTVLPCLWTIGEYFRENAFTGFGWGEAGYTQIADSALAGYAPVAGIHLVTFAVVLTAALGAGILLSKRLVHALPAIAALIALWVVGAVLQQVSFTRLQDKTVRAALAQGNIPQTLKWDDSAFSDTLKRYLLQVASTRADIVILPETAIPMFRQVLPEGILAQFAEQAQRNGSDLALGIPQFAADGVGYENAVIALTGSSADMAGGKFPYYAKNHLVPFGEYIPLPAVTGWLYNMMNIPLAGFSPGGAAQKPLVLGGLRVAFNICYEDGFGDELIASAKQSDILANVSNMAWYGNSHAKDMQLQMSQARALELGRYMMRATNTGLTAVVDNKGRVTAMLAPDISGVLEAEVRAASGETPYMRLGGSFPLILFLAAVVAMLSAYGFYKRKSKLKC